MARLLSTLLVLGLLGGTAAAFAVTEGLKLERSPITRTRVDKLISPVCSCPHHRAVIRFKLRHADTLRIAIIRPNGDTVATLAHHYFRRGFAKVFWGGRDDAGSVVADGKYRVRIHLAKHHQTINLPNTILVDTKPPTISAVRIRPVVISPNHDGRADYATVLFHVSGTARPLLYVDGKLVGRGRLMHGSGKLLWFGKSHGHAFPAGSYAMTLRAEDRAGNVSAPTQPERVRIRFVQLSGAAIRVPAGKRFSVHVVTDAKQVSWVLAGRSGESGPVAVRLRAPRRAGRYTLYVTAAGHSARAVVVVTGR